MPREATSRYQVPGRGSGRRAPYLAGIGVGFAVGWNITDVGAVATDLSHAYGVGLATIGLFTTAQFVVHLCMQVPAGRLADRFGARRVGLGATAILACANALALIAPHVWLALVAKALCGFGTGLGFVGGSDYVRAAGGSALAQGFYGGGTVAAPGLALAVVPALEGPLGFRAPYVSAAVVALVFAAVVLASPEVPPGRRHAGEHVDTRLLRDRRLARFAAIHTASFGLSVVVGNWVVTLLRKHGIAHDAAAVTGSLTLLLGFFTRTLGGLLMRARPEWTPLLVAAGLVVGGAGTIALAASLPFAALVVASAVVGLAAGLPFAPAFAGAAAARPRDPGAAVGYVNAWAALAIVAGTPLLGLAFSLPGRGRIGFLVVGALWIISALATPRRRDYARNPVTSEV
jgi:MFS family permease